MGLPSPISTRVKQGGNVPALPGGRGNGTLHDAAVLTGRAIRSSGKVALLAGNAVLKYNSRIADV
jgi:hypothetical protein